ncbi:hypothetical protein L596_030445 [Steinernema carpocapsae]|uniref:Uncharacterized protein n=1 Tax=Steinernema carpocapsae TaxID=34508 RepID=A0A4U5LPE1_STECR|nr:hypothetical protein L596_030445 [Steinernema carpocapsae]
MDRELQFSDHGQMINSRKRFKLSTERRKAVIMNTFLKYQDRELANLSQPEPQPSQNSTQESQEGRPRQLGQLIGELHAMNPSNNVMNEIMDNFPTVVENMVQGMQVSDNVRNFMNEGELIPRIMDAVIEDIEREMQEPN